MSSERGEALALNAIEPPDRAALLLGYTAVRPSAIRLGVTRLADALAGRVS